MPAQATLWEDGLATWHVCPFLDDAAFRQAYELGRATGSWGEQHLRYRTYVCCWAASHGLRLDGDFVECGVHRGGFARAIVAYTNLAARPERRFFLVDTFCGFPEEQRELAAPNHRHDYREDCFADVVATFRGIENVRILRGAVPEILAAVDTDRVAFLGIDMNCAEPEIAAGAWFWDRLSVGACVVLDDYGFDDNYKRQRLAWDRFAAERGTAVFALPTGQGLLLKV